MTGKKHMSRICFVPGCKTGYKLDVVRNKKQGKRNPSLFKAPNDSKRLEQWQRVINRADKSLTSEDVVCELHFLEDDVLKYFETVLFDGTVNKIERGRPTLKNEAVPCKFPKPHSKKRRKGPSERTEFVKMKKRKESLVPVAEAINPLDDDDDEFNGIEVVDVVDHTFDRLKDNLDLIYTPNGQWSGTFIPGKNVVLFVEWDETYNPKKKIVIHQDMSFKILFRKSEIFLPDKITKISSFQELEDLMKSINSMPI